MTALHEALVKFRGRDINLQIAAGSAESQTCLYEIPGTGLSTLDTEIAERHQSTGFAVVERSIHVQTLDAVLQAHPCDAIHFLKIDVEGWEHDVLRGIDFTRHRPWIVLVEATEPNSEIPSFGAWEPMLLSKRYRFAYFDGLNRFYVAEEHANLVSTFSRPVNSGDHFIRWPELAAKRELRRVHWGQRSQSASSQEADLHVSALTEWATSADRHGRALEHERDALRTGLAAERQARESERHDAKEQIEALTEWATSAEVYGKSLVQRVAELESELKLQLQARETERAEAQKHVDALTEWATSADAYGKSLVEVRTHLESLLASEREASIAALARSREELEAAAARAALSERRVQAIGAVRDRVEAAREIDRADWQKERASLQAAIDELDRRLKRLTQHWAVRAFVGQNHLSNISGLKHK